MEVLDTPITLNTMLDMHILGTQTGQAHLIQLRQRLRRFLFEFPANDTDDVV